MSLSRSAWIAVAAFFLIAVAGVLLRPLLAVDETRYLAVAWEMWLNKSFFVPTKNFELYAHKPPLLFWSVDLVWLVTGVSEVAARLVGPAYGTLAVVLTGVLAGRLWRGTPGIGARAMLALCGMLVFVVSSGLTMFDAMLAAMTLLGMLALLEAVDTGQRRWWAALGVAIALGVLAKGPVILIHLGPAILTAPIWARERERTVIFWRPMLAGLGIALGTALVVLAFWLLPAIITGGPDYREAVLWTQTAGRVTDSFAHRKPVWFFAALLPVMLFPWVFVPALWRAAFRARWREPGLALCGIWAVAAFVLFSLISGKQIHYLVPELPALALIVARLSQGPTGRPVFRPLIPALIAAAAAIAGIAASQGLIPLGAAEPMLQPLSMLLAWGLAMLALAWISVQVGGLRGGAILVLGAALAFNLLVGLTRAHTEFDTNRVAALIQPYDGKGIALVGDSYQAEFNFTARLRHPVAAPETAEARAAWQAAHPDGLILGRAGPDDPPWPRAGSVSWRNVDYGLWHVADAPKAGGRP